MKVAFAHTDFRIYWGARLKALHTFLEKRGIELQVIEIAGLGSPYSFAGAANESPSYRHCLFPGKKIEEIPAEAACRALSYKLDELEPDIVFAGAIAYSSGAASVRWTAEKNKRCIVFDDARLQDVPRKWYVNFIKKKVYSGVDAILCPSSDWTDTFRFFGFKPEQIFSGVDVIDNQFWARRKNDKAEHPLRRKYFLAVGRQIPVKNFLFLLRAYNRYVKTAGHPVNLIMIGDGSEQESIATYIKENGLDGLVQLLPFQNQESLKSLYVEASWLILPSLRETWGLVVNEAMASGLPVLVSNRAGCASTLVKDGENGFTFSPDDIEKLTGLLGIASTMTDDRRRKMGMRSLEIISDWGLERFCSGVYDAINYVASIEKNEPGLLSGLIIKNWKGRYKPL